MSRGKLALAVSALLSLSVLPAVAGAAPSPALVKGEEVGFFGGATVTHTVSVFVYSHLGPAAGNGITVCLEGKCQRAHGHDARLAWYSATFRTHGLRMGDRVRFTVLASDGARRSRVQVNQPLLCMHNDGSTPQN
jgi:hypothetical protein